MFGIVRVTCTCNDYMTQTCSRQDARRYAASRSVSSDDDKYTLLMDVLSP